MDDTTVSCAPPIERRLLRSLLDRDPADLLAAFAALPPAHPSRPAVRERVVEAWLPLAQHLARRYASRSEPVEDLCQVAAVGLIKAVDRFDPARGEDFVAFAVPTITGEIKRHFRDHTWHVHVRRRVKDRLPDLRQAVDEFQQRLHRAPTVAELAERLDTSEAEVREAMCAAQAYHSMPLERPREHGDELDLYEAIGAEEYGYDLAEHRPALAAALARLDPRAREVVWLRFFCDLTQQQIADRIGVSQMHISRILARTTDELRGALAVTA